MTPSLSERLGALWDEGGDAGPADFDALRLEVEARLSALKPDGNPPGAPELSDRRPA